MRVVLEGLDLREWSGGYMDLAERRWTSAMNWVSIADAAYWTQQGERCEYYNIEDFTAPFFEVAQKIGLNHRARPAVTNPGGPKQRKEGPNGYENLRRFLSGISELVTESFNYYDGPTEKARSQFQRDMAIATDLATPELMRCIEMLVFAAPEDWFQQMETLNEIAQLIELNPSLSLTPQVMDAVSWAFISTEEFGEIDPVETLHEDSDRRRPSHFGYRLVEIRSHSQEGRQRLTQLRTWRERVERAAPFLTEDPAAAASIGLRNALLQLPDQSPNRADLLQTRDDPWETPT